jgi:hypothetical protein
LRILNLCFSDNAGAAYTLSHALNKFGHTSINLRAQNNYLNYPTIASLQNYNREDCALLIERSDVVVFHSAVRPFMEGLGITPEIIDNKKKILYFHGSEIRAGSDQLKKQADEYLGNYKILVSTPDLTDYIDHATWMPCIRSFSEIEQSYGKSATDNKALTEYGVPFTKTQIGHSPTNTQVKGSHIFQMAITRLLDVYPNAEWVSITDIPWDSCIRTMSTLDIFLDQALLGAYGMAAVEASIFKIPIFAYISPKCEGYMEGSGIANPFLQWKDEDELIERIYYLCEHPVERKKFGEQVYNYCKVMHDEKPGVKRFIEALKDA